MHLIDALKINGSPFDIPDCDREELPILFKKLGFKVGAEIGVYKAGYTVSFLKQGLKMYGIDPWVAYDDYATNPKYNRFQERQNFLYGHSQRAVKPYGDLCKFVRKTSMEAAKDFENNSLDFVYIDGHHGFKYVAEDIWEWSKKVKPGGIISGHDYGDYHHSAMDPYVIHVRYVIDAYTKALDIKNWYVIGSPEKKDGEKRDGWRSWFWFNQR